ncbi:MAG: (d)CMP kinase [Geminicoccaceae bacterium]|nr:MAG: (d)CMP kinase [Geminicoccaceae bacterium]
MAIDGPASSGKSTIGARLAADLELPFLDTGLLYRAVGKAVGETRIEDAAAAARAARSLDPTALDDPALHNETVGALASRVAVMPEVRQALLAWQRDFAARPGGAVLVGRDIGSHVCPAAPCKIFITATVEARAARRFEQLRALDDGVIHSAVLAELRRRDARDAARAIAPLVTPDDALVLDTTSLDVAATLEAARGFILERAARCR